MRIISILFIVAVVLAGCGATDPVFLRHSETAQTVKCGPYATRGIGRAFAAAQHEAQCISDYQRQGYERVPR